MDKNHYILSFERKNSGAFEHSWNLSKNLLKKGKNVFYYAHWFNSPIFEINLNTEEKKEISLKSLEEKKGIFHLHTHTWEYDKMLEKIALNTSSRIIYYLHAVIPYYYLSSEEKKAFLENNLPLEHMKNTIMKKLSSKERAQLTAIEKSDYLITINKTHKKALEFLGVNKKIGVLENFSDFSDFDDSTFLKRGRKADDFREELNKENILLYCGNFYLRKGSFRLIDSFVKIKKEFPSSMLILLGARERDVKELIDKRFNKDILSDMLIVPWIDKSKTNSKEEFLKYYLSSDVLIQPMITEELYSKSVIDAMALGIPTITCKSPYTIGSSKTGGEIYNSFKYIKENPEKVKEIIESARRKVLRENTLENYISNLEKIIFSELNLK